MENGMSTTNAIAELEAQIETMKAEHEEQLRAAFDATAKVQARLGKARDVIAKQRDQLEAKPSVVAQVTTDAGAFGELFAALNAEVGRMNHSVERNKDGSWPAIQPDSEDRRYALIDGAILADKIAGAMHSTLTGVVLENGRKVPGLSEKLSVLVGDVNALLADIESTGGIEHASDYKISKLERLVQRRNSMERLLNATIAARSEAVSAYLDCQAGNITRWVPYTERSKGAPEPKVDAKAIDRRALLAAAKRTA